MDSLRLDTYIVFFNRGSLNQWFTSPCDSKTGLRPSNIRLHRPRYTCTVNSSRRLKLYVACESSAPQGFGRVTAGRVGRLISSFALTLWRHWTDWMENQIKVKVKVYPLLQRKVWENGSMRTMYHELRGLNHRFGTYIVTRISPAIVHWYPCDLDLSQPDESALNQGSALNMWSLTGLGSFRWRSPNSPQQVYTKASRRQRPEVSVRFPSMTSWKRRKRTYPIPLSHQYINWNENVYPHYISYVLNNQ